MKRSLGCSLTILALVSGLAHADGSGTLYQDGKPLALVSAYAYRGPDPFDKTKEITTVVFSDKKIDAAAANAAANRGEAVEASSVATTPRASSSTRRRRLAAERQYRGGRIERLAERQRLVHDEARASTMRSASKARSARTTRPTRSRAATTI